MVFFLENMYLEPWVVENNVESKTYLGNFVIFKKKEWGTLPHFLISSF